MELIETYELSGEKSGIIMDKALAHERGILHKSICVFIMNDSNEILLQKRSPTASFGNYYDISFAGHIKAHETPLDAVIREGKEELGIDIDVRRLQFLFSCKEYLVEGNYKENEILNVYLYTDNTNPEEYVFSDNEVSCVKYVPLPVLEDMVKHNSERLIPYNTLYGFLFLILNQKIGRSE